MGRTVYGKTRGEINKLKYIRNYERNKFYNGYNKTFKILQFQLPPNIYEEFNSLCEGLGVSKKEMILKEYKEMKNE